MVGAYLRKYGNIRAYQFYMNVNMLLVRPFKSLSELSHIKRSNLEICLVSIIKII